MDQLYFAFGYCRSTVGGYDVWTETYNENKPDEYLLCNPIIQTPIFSESNIRGTTINKMNYLAMRELLSYLLDIYTGSLPNTTVTIACNCRLMFKQLCGHLHSKQLNPEYQATYKLLDQLKKRCTVNLTICDNMHPPNPFSNPTV